MVIYLLHSHRFILMPYPLIRVDSYLCNTDSLFRLPLSGGVSLHWGNNIVAAIRYEDVEGSITIYVIRIPCFTFRCLAAFVFTGEIM